MIFYFSLSGGLLTCNSFLYCLVNLSKESVFLFGGQGIIGYPHFEFFFLFVYLFVFPSFYFIILFLISILTSLSLIILLFFSF